MIKRRTVLAVSLLVLLNVFVGIAAAVPERPQLEKRVFIHHFPGRPENPVKTPKPPSDPHAKHYTLLGKGVEWKTTPVTYYIDPDLSGLADDSAATAVFAAAEEWDRYTGEELFDDACSSWIIHDGTWDDVVPDERNEILFGDYPQNGVIAVTVIWGVWSGPVGQRRITEFDVMFDTDFAWGDATVSGSLVMDLQNIATHELGHGAGLGDIYYCSLETMYGYSSYGETGKRDLYTGDIAGIQALYGA